MLWKGLIKAIAGDISWMSLGSSTEDVAYGRLPFGT